MYHLYEIVAQNVSCDKVWGNLLFGLSETLSVFWNVE